MPKKTPAVDTSKLNQIDAYTYSEYDRANIPPVGMAQYDKVASPEAKYEYDPHIDPSLQWAGKKEGTSFEVPTTSIHIHEVIKPHKIIRSVQTMGDDYVEEQGNLFESDVERAKRRNDSIEFYQHKNKWTNRLIAGDSLVIMNSMLKKEGMAGQVQMVYIDPPYGIKYGSNFQPFVNKRDVKDKKDEDLTTEPEMIKAFRDTWELGIHSYLTYLRDRLLLARELLSDTGSIFVQISDENVHYVREICDEVFGVNNFCSLISFRKTTGQSGYLLSDTNDYLVWYAKNKTSIKFRSLFLAREGFDWVNYDYVQLQSGIRRKMTKEEKEKPSLLPENSKVYRRSPLTSASSSETTLMPVEFKGKMYTPGRGGWKTGEKGFIALKNSDRLEAYGETLAYIRYADDFPFFPLSNSWIDTASGGYGAEKVYVVQTNQKVIQRCLLMTTDPGDLVLDITCGSGTTAYVAEQWGRRWVTCDTSRIAITLAKKRLMTATFDYYKINNSETTDKQEDNKDSFVNIRDIRGNSYNCPSNGFIYKTVPHVTLKSIANNEPAEKETLYDQPEIEKRKVRISGPFTVEALPAPVVLPLNDDETGPVPFFHENATKKQSDWMQELCATGIRLRQNEKLEFARVEPLEGTKYLHGDAETKGTDSRRAVICFAGETRPLDTRIVAQAMDEAEGIRPKPAYIIFAAFQFDPAAAEYIDKTHWPGITLLKAQMNPDLMTADLKKKSSSSQSFWLVGQPDIELIQIDKGKDKGLYKVKVNGFDYYNVKQGIVDSGDSDKIAMWSLDTDYDGMCIDPKQVFFPMEGKNEGWDKLAKVLKAEINQDLIEKYHGTESLPFTLKENSTIAVKIVDDRGIESLKILRIGAKNGKRD